MVPIAFAPHDYADQRRFGLGHRVTPLKHPSEGRGLSSRRTVVKQRLDT
jgi:hypothetical protein